LKERPLNKAAEVPASWVSFDVSDMYPEGVESVCMEATATPPPENPALSSYLLVLPILSTYPVPPQLPRAKLPTADGAMVSPSVCPTFESTSGTFLGHEEDSNVSAECRL
jgi:hypothetical protein